MKLILTNFGIRHPWLLVLIVMIVSSVFLLQFPKVHFDNDPENMLSPDEHVRVFHHRVKEKFNLYDFVIVGIVNKTHPDGIFNVQTLGRIDDLTKELLSLRQGTDGSPVVTLPARGVRETRNITLDLAPRNVWERALGLVFRQDSNNLFDEKGNSAVISRELISPSVVDNIKQAEFGSLKIEYLMEEPPATREEALTIRYDAMNNPLYRGTMVSEDGQAIALYIPILAKTFSYNVAALVRALTEDWEGDDQVYITGLPVAEDTFGVEMLVQMAISAPMAGLAIFLLLFLFFRRISIIIAPMIVAMISVVCTMGLLIGLGFDVHIMSSMIAIFLMPIAVADSVHILSEFHDTYHRFGDRAKTLRSVIGHLFKPMFYTSLTTMAGFASLGTTPIPPVRIFGLHVAFGVGLAWLLTMTMLPAYIMLAIPQKTLDRLAQRESRTTSRGARLDRLLERLGRFSYVRWKLILVVTVLVMGIASYGIGLIRVNDNPVKWFTASHPIRIADKVLNEHFGGTYTAYLTLSATDVESQTCGQVLSAVADTAERRFRSVLPRAVLTFKDALEGIESRYEGDDDFASSDCFQTLAETARQIDNTTIASWENLADGINYLDPKDLTYRKLTLAVEMLDDVNAQDKEILFRELRKDRDLAGEALLNRALDITDRHTGLSFLDLVLDMEAQFTAPPFKQPDVLRYVESLQEHMDQNEVIGKTTTAVDALKKASYELNYQLPSTAADAREPAQVQRRNEENYAVPNSVAAVGQVFTQLEGTKKKDSLFHLVSRDYREANMWVQLKSGDNIDMEKVVTDVEVYVALNPPPTPIRAEWAGLTYLNVVWQDKMVRGMLTSLATSFAVVFFMMILLFRSFWYGILAMIPLSVTISFIYGLIGILGKDYDMPVAILSAMTLGLSIDFAIHFLERAREIRRKLGTWRAACCEMFKEPAMAISRNAIIISIGFTPLLLAPLVPYKTVGFFLAMIMAISWLATLFLLPALLTMLKKRLFAEW